MLILACDTSTKFLSLAIVKSGKVLEGYHAEEGSRSDALFVVIDKLLKSSNVELSDFDLFAVGVGPGSFTGLRIGICCFKTLAFCLNKPLVGINSFDAIAHNFVKTDELVCVIEDAKKGKIYAAIYAFDKKSDLSIIQKSSLFSIDSFFGKIRKKALFAGNGIELYKERILSQSKKFSLAKRRLWYPKAGKIACLGAEKFKKGKLDDPRRLVPLYLHSERANITKPKKLI